MTRTLLAITISAVLMGGTFITGCSSANAGVIDRTEQEEVWLTQESEHFKINFLKGHESQAARSLDIAEQVHIELVPFFNYKPKNKTEIVLVDDFDVSNGWATPLPFAQMRLFMSPPDDVNSLESNDEWLHLLIRHEYAHVIHMEMEGGVVSSLRKIFGRNPFLFPHAFTPSFMLEGLAVYLETNKSLGYGRLNGSDYAMKMRMEVGEKAFKNLGEVTIAARKFPLGYNYLYGAYFIEYLTDTYGEEKLQLFLKNYSHEVVPFLLLQRNARVAFSKDFNQLWSDFQINLNERFAGDYSQMLSQAVSGKTLSTTPFLQIFTTSEDNLFVDLNNGEDRASIKMLATDEATVSNIENWTTLTHNTNIIDMDYDKDNGLVVARLIGDGESKIFADLYLFQDQQWHQLTDTARFRKMRWIPQSTDLIASRKESGISELWVISTDKDEEQRKIWSGETDTVLGGFDISPDGHTLVASIKRPHQGWNLELFDIATSTWRALTDSKSIENNPVYLDNGRIVYSADYNGVYNIYSIEPKSGSVDKLTQEVGGAFTPQWQAGAGLIYQSYQSDGYSLKTLSAPTPLDTFNISEQQGEFNYPEPVQQIATKSAPRAYSAWESIYPRTWFPMYSKDDDQTLASISTNGTDALGLHQYNVTVSWDLDNKNAEYALYYAYDNWNLMLQRTHDFTTFKKGGKGSKRIEQKDDALLQRSNIFTAFEDKLSFHSAVYWDRNKEVDKPKFGVTSPYVSKEEMLVGGAITFDERQYYLDVPGVGYGAYLDVVIETNDWLDSDYEGNKYQGKAAFTWDLPGTTSLTAQIAGGYADPKAERFKMGGHDAEDDIALFGRDTQILRGYNESVQVGNKYLTQRLTMRTAIHRFEQNWGVYPVGLGDVSGAVFVDSGATWTQNSQRKQLTSMGASLTVEAALGYMTFPITFSYAHGFDDKLGKDTFFTSVMGTF